MLFGLVWFLAALFQVSVLSRVGVGGGVAEIKNTAKLSLAWAVLCNIFRCKIFSLVASPFENLKPFNKPLPLKPLESVLVWVVCAYTTEAYKNLNHRKANKKEIQKI